MTVAVGKDVVLKYDGEKIAFPRKEIPLLSHETYGVYKAIASGTAQIGFYNSMADLGHNVMWLDTNFSSEKLAKSGMNALPVYLLTMIVAISVFVPLFSVGLISPGVYIGGTLGLVIGVYLMAVISGALIERDATETLNSHAKLFDDHYDTLKSGLEKQLAGQRAARAGVLAIDDASIPPEYLRQLEITTYRQLAVTLKALDELEKARKFFETLRSQGKVGSAPIEVAY